MTQEEKAKVYDEVVNKLRRFMAQGVEPLITSADVQDFFPELKESEDEKIRKELIEHIKANCESDFILFQKFSPDEVIAWLENRSNTSKEAGFEWNAEKKELKMLENQGKSMWTEEDEERLQSCIIALQGKGLMGGVDTMDSKWLKSLKQRIHDNSAKTCKNDTLLDLLNKMPSCITVDGIDYHFVMKKTSIYLAYYACYNGNGEEGRGNAIFGITAHSPIDLLAEMLEILKEKGLLE